MLATKIDGRLMLMSLSYTCPIGSVVMPCGHTAGSLTSDQGINLRANAKTLVSGQAMTVAMNEIPNVIIQNI